MITMSACGSGSSAKPSTGLSGDLNGQGQDITAWIMADSQGTAWKPILDDAIARSRPRPAPT